MFSSLAIFLVILLGSCHVDLKCPHGSRRGTPGNKCPRSSAIIFVCPFRCFGLTCGYHLLTSQLPRRSARKLLSYLQ
uniref:Putative secreted protein n=1 Tax=Panstrongylus lignarius TaxID=156445 RepID=A0A224Y3R7_9HEMI